MELKNAPSKKKVKQANRKNRGWKKKLKALRAELISSRA
jgi:hypothetical protein